MKKLFTLLLIIPFTLLSQEPLKKITDIDKSSGVKEVYYVLKSDKSIRHGEYKKYGKGKLMVDGNYLNGEKEVFRYYDFDGKVSLQYNFIKSEVIKYIEKESNLKVFDFDGNVIEGVKSPIPLFSPVEMRRFIAYNLQYPNLAKEKGITGKTETSLYIDKDGNLINVKVYKNTNELLDDEAVRVFNLMPTEWKWIPALKDSTFIDAIIVMPLTFKLN